MPRTPARRNDDLPEYTTLLAAVQGLLKQGQNEAYQRIDQIRARTYVAIGAQILAAELRHQQRADYGRQVIAALARDLGFSESNIYIDQVQRHQWSVRSPRSSTSGPRAAGS